MRTFTTVPPMSATTETTARAPENQSRRRHQRMDRPRAAANAATIANDMAGGRNPVANPRYGRSGKNVPSRPSASAVISTETRPRAAVDAMRIASARCARSGFALGGLDQPLGDVLDRIAQDGEHQRSGTRQRSVGEGAGPTQIGAAGGVRGEEDLGPVVLRRTLA